jgi:peptidoglycan/LPS O-acetylase OafA/YrhL
LILFLHRWGRRYTIQIIGILSGLSLAACVWKTMDSASTAFYLSPFRGWELLLGTLLALREKPGAHRPGKALRELAAAAGVGLILWAVFAFSERTGFPGLNALVPCFGAALVIYSGPKTLVGHVLASAPLVFVGKISYSLYLWHWPLLIFAACLYVEPLTTSKRRRLFVGATVTSALALAFGAFGHYTRGYPGRFSERARVFDDAARIRTAIAADATLTTTNQSRTTTSASTA